MGNRFLRKTPADKLVYKLVTKTVIENRLIEDGDRILLACSGGKDSTVLAWALSSIKSALKINYELMALHISTDFCSCCKKGILEKTLNGWGIPFTDLDVPVIGRLKPGRKMNCYWCSTQRRTELLSFACARNFNKIALGHHLDDMIETFFMNMTRKGTFETMPVMLSYRKYPVKLIRPLALIEEKEVITCAEKLDITKAVCTCPYGVNSGRKEIRKKLISLTDDSGAVKRRILSAINRKVSLE